MIQSYVINLDKDVARLEFFESNFKKLGLAFERVAAVDGRVVSDDEYQAFMKDRPRHNKDWARGQMGCFLSHYLVWQKVASGDQRFCAVFEDDIHISDDLAWILMNDAWIPDGVDIIRLETSTNRVRLTSQAILTQANRTAYGVQSTSWCAGGYLISRQAAQALLDLPWHTHEPADAMLYNFSDSPISTRFNILQFNPALCTQDKHLVTGGGKFYSNIESPLTHREVWRNKIGRMSPLVIGRALYRTLLGYKRIEFK
ncbi:glycosyltransferase family 25 protein [Rhodoferax sp. U2-2l]|uniref:glycosyltransferase family 25 protein n=1 Tax=Rhodoferax sp. U2-2l TaxID=2884000 RepID=UPI001D09DCCF|nr:glycosyltransferase family 25 protein [Rhodoferax sp. U2-2l]MCB8746895.1 glycosyltransferase family 25 protein [Rhodoferax sp. U2-2l]